MNAAKQIRDLDTVIFAPALQTTGAQFLPPRGVMWGI